MKNLWPGKVKGFQESYMTQERTNELCFWSHSYCLTRTIRLSQTDLSLPAFVEKSVCVPAHTPGMTVKCSHLSLPPSQAEKGVQIPRGSEGSLLQIIFHIEERQNCIKIVYASVGLFLHFIKNKHQPTILIYLTTLLV